MYPQALAAIVAFFGTTLLTACGRPADATPRNADHLDDTVRVAAGQVGAIGLTLVDSVVIHDLRRASALAAPEVSDLVMRERIWYVLDYMSKRVLVIDSTGSIIDSIGTDGDIHAGGKGEGIVSPVRLAFAGDTLLVVDIGSTDDIRAFSSTKRELPYTRTPHVAGASDIAVTPAGLVVALSGTAKAPNRNRVFLTPASGEILHWSCPADRRFREAGDRSMLTMYDYTSLGVGSGGKVGCVQMVSPVVAVFDPNSGRTTFTTMMPPDYRAPATGKRTQNAKKASEYEASWTPHHHAYPTENGVISVFELTQHGRGRSFLLFACDSAGGNTRCGQRRVAARLIRFVAPDTLLFATGDSAITLSRYHVTTWY